MALLSVFNWLTELLRLLKTNIYYFSFMYKTNSKHVKLCAFCSVFSWFIIMNAFQFSSVQIVGTVKTKDIDFSLI